MTTIWALWTRRSTRAARHAVWSIERMQQALVGKHPVALASMPVGYVRSARPARRMRPDPMAQKGSGTARITWSGLGDPTLTDAILVRLVHAAYRIELIGPSMRPNTRSGTPDHEEYKGAARRAEKCRSAPQDRPEGNHPA